MNDTTLKKDAKQVFVTLILYTREIMKRVISHYTYKLELK